MTGHEHYLEAEKTLQLAGYDTADNASSAEPDRAEALMIAAAQVHATLALAAATALIDGGAVDGNAMPAVDRGGWIKAASELGGARDCLAADGPDGDPR